MTTNCMFTYLPAFWRGRAAALLFSLLCGAIQASGATCPTGLAAIDPTPNTDFVSDGHGIVLHLPTGLLWKQCNEGLSGIFCENGYASIVPWRSALSTAKNSAFSGFTDWRLPNKQELESLIDTRCHSPSINETVFPGAMALPTWTSTSVSNDFATLAWAVDFFDGDSIPIIKYPNSSAVRLVRSTGQSIDQTFFDWLSEARPILNLDGSDATSRFSPATSGVLLLRYLLGFRDSALTAGALGTNPQRSASQIAAHIAANLSAFDVDGDGKVLMSTDGVMILRRLLGLSGAALTNGAKNSARSDADIAAVIDALKQ